MTLTAINTLRNDAHSETVQLLRDFLAQAEAGEIVAVAIAAIRPNMKAVTTASRCENVTALIGACEIIKGRILISYERDNPG